MQLVLVTQYMLRSRFAKRSQMECTNTRLPHINSACVICAKLGNGGCAGGVPGTYHPHSLLRLGLVALIVYSIGDMERLVLTAACPPFNSCRASQALLLQ